MRRLAIPAAALLALLVASPALAQTASLTVATGICPEGYEGNTYAADCTDVPDPALPFELSGPTEASGETDGEGMVTFSELDAGTYTVSGGAPGDFTETVVECTAEGGEVSPSQDGNRVELDLGDDQPVTCNWYIIPMSAAGEEPPDTAVLPADAGPETPMSLLVVAGMIVTAAGIRLTAARIHAQD